MQDSKIEAFFREFPFLRDYIDAAVVEQTNVARIGEDLLHQMPQRHEDLWEGEQRHERFIFVGKEGENIYEVEQDGGWLAAPVKWNKPSTWFAKFFSGETVGDALMRLPKNKADKIAHVLYLELNRYRPHHWKVIVYKLPKDTTLLTWIESIIASRRTELQEEVDRVTT